jgi:DNA-binding NarL/FixJ family response regulator
MPEPDSVDDTATQHASDRPPAPVRVAVVDDNTWYREGLGAAGGLRPHQRVVARAADAAELSDAFFRLPGEVCDVVVLDLRIVSGLAPDPLHGGQVTEPPVQGSAAVAHLLAAAGEAVKRGKLRAVPAVLCYTQENAPRVHLACLLAGAAGVVHKDQPLDWLAEAIDAVAAGGIVVTPALASLIVLLADQRRLDLTDAQAQVLALAGHGYTRERIAHQLRLSVSTVDKHLAAIRATFGPAKTYTDLADAFGLRDLAPSQPEAGSARKIRTALAQLKRRLS